MPGRETLCLGVLLLAVFPAGASAQHGAGGGGATIGGLGAVGRAPGMLLVPSYYATVGADGAPQYYLPPPGPPGWSFSAYGPPLPPAAMTMPPPGPGALIGSPPPEIHEQMPRVAPGPIAPDRQPPQPAETRGDEARARQLTTFGDRLFRAGNFKRAEERYRQAIAKAPNRAAAYVRLAQIDLTRGRYRAAADHLREAQTAQPGWIEKAPDIQRIYGEPTDFARRIARLESHVQAHPRDRDAWLLLGAEWFLSGRTARAADVFLRLDDPRRKPDRVLSAFLDATNQGERPARRAPGERPDGERPNDEGP